MSEPTTVRDDIRRVAAFARAIHADDVWAADAAIGGMPADQYAMASGIVLEVALNALALGLRIDFDGAVREVETQLLARLADE